MPATSAESFHAAKPDFSLVEIAERLVPELRERAAQTASDRLVSREVVSKLKESGLLRLLQPKEFGGSSGDYLTFTSIIRTLALGCASTAWIYAVLGEHNWIISMLPKDAQCEVWGKNPQSVASSSLGPSGTGREECGGFWIRGRWPFSSGCDHADWVLIGATVERPSGESEYRIFLVPKNEITIIDDWYVFGLRGTGSKTLFSNGVFVPDYRTISQADLKSGNGAGRFLYPDYELCRAERTLFASFSLSSVMVGLASQAVNVFASSATTRISRGTRLAELESVQLKLAESAAEAEVASLLVDETCGRNIAAVRQGKAIGVDELARTRRNSAYCVRLAHSAIKRLFEASGGGALHDGIEIQGIYRDAAAASNHLFLTWENNAKHYGQVRLGLPINRLEL